MDKKLSSILGQIAISQDHCFQIVGMLDDRNKPYRELRGGYDSESAEYATIENMTHSLKSETEGYRKILRTISDDFYLKLKAAFPLEDFIKIEDLKIYESTPPVGRSVR